MSHPVILPSEFTAKLVWKEATVHAKPDEVRSAVHRIKSALRRGIRRMKAVPLEGTLRMEVMRLSNKTLQVSGDLKGVQIFI